MLLAGVLSLFGCGKKLSDEEISALYLQSMLPVVPVKSVFHLGHSLTNRDVPWMLKQFANEDFSYRSQLGWGASLKQHWEPSIAINGYEEENDHPHFMDVMDAIESAKFDAFVLTEMVEIKDAIKHHNSAHYLEKFSHKIFQYNPNARLYVYETWHHIDDSEGWQFRLERDIQKYWESSIIDTAISGLDNPRPIYVIPVGQVMAALFREVSKNGGVGVITKPADMFKIKNDGQQDTIHLNDTGNYLSALVHYAVIFQKSPVGVTANVKRSDGGRYTLPDAETVLRLQEIVWSVVTTYPRTGVQVPH